MGKRYMPFVGFTIFVGVVSLLGCAIISPDPASELVGEWESLDGSVKLKVNPDKTFVAQSSNETNEGTIAVSNDYILLVTSKDKKTNESMYFFIKESRLFPLSYVADGSVSGIKGKWKFEYRVKSESSETSIVQTLEITDNQIIISTGIGSYTNDYERIDGSKDIASLLVFKYEGNVIGTNAYVLADWKGKKMLFFTEIGGYDSSVLKKKK